MEHLVRRYESALDEHDAETRHARAERAAWIATLGQPEDGWAFFGDYGVIAPWSELRQDYIQGAFVSAILVGQAFIENLLAGGLHAQGEHPDGMGFSELLRRSLEVGWLTPPELELLDDLRRSRNPYAHFRNWEHKDGLVARSLAAGSSPEVLLERDARHLIRVLFNLVNRRPFALGSIEIPTDDELGPWIHPDQQQLAM
jgi:hypothetical protein